MNHLSKIISTINRKYSLYKTGDYCFYCYLQIFKIKKVRFSKMDVCKPNKNNDRKNLKHEKRRKIRKIEKIFYAIEKIFYKIGKIRENFLLFKIKGFVKKSYRLANMVMTVRWVPDK